MKLLPITLVALAACGLVSPASALTPRGRSIDGKVATADHATRQATIDQKGGKGPLPFTWNANTTFVTGASFVEPKVALASGAQVRVSYHRPFFGPATVSRVILLQKAPRCCSRC